MRSDTEYRPNRAPRRQRRREFPVTLALLAFTVSASLGGVWWVRQKFVRHFERLQAQGAVRAGYARAARRAAMNAHPARRRYPYSIIPGGAYTPGELLLAQSVDPVVARHYEGFKKNRLRTVPASFGRPVYVSYRRGDAIYWTHRPLYLREGETLLTDGVLYARSRCGNRISETPQQPVDAAMEPPPEVLDTPDLPEAPEVEAVLPPPDTIAEARPPSSSSEESKHGPSSAVSGSAARYYNPVLTPLFGGGWPVRQGPRVPSVALPNSGSSTQDQKDDQTTDEQEPPPAVTPEPGSFLLLVTGLSVVTSRWLYARRYGRSGK